MYTMQQAPHFGNGQPSSIVPYPADAFRELRHPVQRVLTLRGRPRRVPVGYDTQHNLQHPHPHQPSFDFGLPSTRHDGLSAIPHSAPYQPDASLESHPIAVHRGLGEGVVASGLVVEDTYAHQHPLPDDNASYPCAELQQAVAAAAAGYAQDAIAAFSHTRVDEQHAINDAYFHNQAMEQPVHDDTFAQSSSYTSDHAWKQLAAVGRPDNNQHVTASLSMANPQPSYDASFQQMSSQLDPYPLSAPATYFMGAPAVYSEDASSRFANAHLDQNLARDPFRQGGRAQRAVHLDQHMTEYRTQTAPSGPMGAHASSSSTALTDFDGAYCSHADMYHSPVAGGSGQYNVPYEDRAQAAFYGTGEAAMRGHEFYGSTDAQQASCHTGAAFYNPAHADGDLVDVSGLGMVGADAPGPAAAQLQVSRKRKTPMVSHAYGVVYRRERAEWVQENDGEASSLELATPVEARQASVVQTHAMHDATALVANTPDARFDRSFGGSASTVYLGTPPCPSQYSIPNTATAGAYPGAVPLHLPQPGYAPYTSGTPPLPLAEARAPSASNWSRPGSRNIVPRPALEAQPLPYAMVASAPASQHYTLVPSTQSPAPVRASSSANRHHPYPVNERHRTAGPSTEPHPMHPATPQVDRYYSDKRTPAQLAAYDRVVATNHQEKLNNALKLDTLHHCPWGCNRNMNGWSPDQKRAHIADTGAVHRELSKRGPYNKKSKWACVLPGCNRAPDQLYTTYGKLTAHVKNIHLYGL